MQTFFVGENGSGRSTLLEGIAAAAAELDAMGGSRDVVLDPTLEHAGRLGAALRLAWTRRSRQGFFLRAEDFFGRLTGLARNEARRLRERREAAMGVRADAFPERPLEGGGLSQASPGALLGARRFAAKRTSDLDSLTEEQDGLVLDMRPAHGPMSLHPTTLGFKAARRWMHQE